MEIGVTWQQSMLPAVGGDQFGAALAAVPPVAGVADMLAAMMGEEQPVRGRLSQVCPHQQMDHLLCHQLGLLL